MTAWWPSIVGVQPASGPSFPSQASVSPPSVAEMSRPRAVVDLAQGGEHLGALLAVHAEDGAEILQGENPKATDHAQEPVRVLRVQRLAVWVLARLLGVRGDCGVESRESARHGEGEQ
jgi:hypothetical protein